VDVFVSQSDPRPLTAQLYEQLRDAIIEGRLEPGDRLAPTRALAADLRVSRSTVTEVYSRLVAEGFIECRSGRGSIVAEIAEAWVHPPSTPSALESTARAAAIAGDARTPHSEAAFDLRPGRVDPALFPGRDWRRAVVHALVRVSPQYGDPAGTAELRGALARWVVRSRRVTATENELIVTSGSGHGIDLVARVLLKPGDVVAVEEPWWTPSRDRPGSSMSRRRTSSRSASCWPDIDDWSCCDGRAGTTRPCSRTTTTASSATSRDRWSRCGASTVTAA